MYEEDRLWLAKTIKNIMLTKGFVRKITCVYASMKVYSFFIKLKKELYEKVDGEDIKEI